MDVLTHWVTGSLTPEQRVWSAAAPAVILITAGILTLIAFAVRNALFGDFHDKEIESRGSSIVLGMWIRRYFVWLVTPIINLLVYLRIPPSAVTLLSLQAAFGAGIALAAGRMALGGWLFLGAGALDLFDGRLARATNTAHPGGAVLDSVVDRYGEGAVYLGLAWYYRSSWVLLVVLFAFFGSMLVPYIRARGESLGVKMSDRGFVQRPERTVVLGLTVGLSPIVEAIMVPGDPHPPHRLAIAGLAFLAVATQISAAQRLLHARNALAGSDPTRRAPSFAVVFCSIFSTVADFALVVWLVYWRQMPLPIATLVGAVFGAAVGFVAYRLALLHNHSAKVLRVGRYALVTLGAALLNAGLVALSLLPEVLPNAAAWWCVRALVILAWSYPLFKEYVFARDEHLLEGAHARS